MQPAPLLRSVFPSAKSEDRQTEINGRPPLISELTREEERRESAYYAHLHGAVAPAADELVGDEVDAVDLVRMAGEVVFDFVRL